MIAHIAIGIGGYIAFIALSIPVAIAIGRGIKVMGE